MVMLEEELEQRQPAYCSNLHHGNSKGKKNRIHGKTAELMTAKVSAVYPCIYEYALVHASVHFWMHMSMHILNAQVHACTTVFSASRTL